MATAHLPFALQAHTVFGELDLPAAGLLNLVRPHMKIVAILVSAIVLLAYLLLMRANPAWGFFHPRGGVFMLAISLVIANAGIWLSGQTDRPLNTRFQLAAAGWIWLVVQGGCIVYFHVSEA